MSSVVETVEKQIEGTIEVTRDNLVVLKNTAYQKYVEAWESMEHLKDSTYDTLSNAWEQAWVSYSTVVKQLQSYGHSSIEKAQSEYDAAKNNLDARTKDIQEWIGQNGEKFKENASDLQADAYDKLGTTRKEAYEKYIQAKESLKSLFTQAHQEASKDTENAENQIKKATARLEKHLASTPSDETKAEWEKTKASLESAKQRAQTEFDEAKAHSESLGARVSGWSQDVLKTLGTESEFVAQRAKDLGEYVSKFATDSKEKVEDSTVGNLLQDKWNAIYKATQEESAYATDIWNKAKESLANFWQTAKEAVGLEDVSSDVTKTPDQPRTADKEVTLEGPQVVEIHNEVPVPEGSGVLLN
eukprot:TRINITY_DN15499_c0_g1_i1.p1 TRINITY_DN15499_c0_g1~~TRINITY_DN15499_c0_g1_i1.p1  ORF type:complete len:367 (-),score=83.34 TRINITY_DN15499_c0_g1_i1:154-1227(-)